LPPDVVVYLGPSLPREAAGRILQADYRPPIRRGDLAQLLPHPPRFVGIVDGEFYQSLAVSPKEILPLLDAGVTVLGAASMGALRAAETWRYGMIGVGRIFRLYCAGAIDGDDEVALTYCPETYRTSSEPLVNFRLALADARRSGVIAAALSSCLIRRLKRLYFPERTVGRFWAEAGRMAPPKELRRLRRFFLTEAPDAKAADAADLLRDIARRDGTS
jgi:TfuA protein